MCCGAGAFEGWPFFLCGKWNFNLIYKLCIEPRHYYTVPNIAYKFNFCYLNGIIAAH